MSLPSSVGLPAEMQLGSLANSLPPDAKSFSVKIQPSNVSTVVGTPFTTPLGTYAILPDTAFPAQNIIFDIPCGTSPSQFLDNRFTTLNFTATLTCSTAGASAGSAAQLGAYLRGSASSYFDRMYITSQNGQIIEDIGEFGLINDTLVALQMNNAVRHGTALQYGFATNGTQSGTDTAMLIGSQGHQWYNAAQTGGPLITMNESHSYSIPLLSGVIGCTADKFLNIGRTSRLQVVLQTTSVLPISMSNNGTVWTTAPTMTITLSNFSIQCEMVDIGINALQLLDSTLVDGKAYIHGTTYRTSSASVPSTTGTMSLLAGIRASSVKSLFARFSQGGSASAVNSCNGKYDSTLPLLNSINFNVGGMKYPQTPINPLLQPSQAFRETQMAIGSFNNSTFQSSIPPDQYCILSAGALTQANNVGATQEQSWYATTSIGSQAQFIFGECLEICARRGLLSGLNCTSAPIFVEMNIASAPTNPHTCYVQAMLDMVLIHDVKSGDISVRI